MILILHASRWSITDALLLVVILSVTSIAACALPTQRVAGFDNWMCRSNLGANAKSRVTKQWYCIIWEDRGLESTRGNISRQASDTYIRPTALSLEPRDEMELHFSSAAWSPTNRLWVLCACTVCKATALLSTRCTVWYN